MTKCYGIFGFGGFARSIMPVIRMQYGLTEEQCFYVDRETSFEVSRQRVISEEEFYTHYLDAKFTVAISDPAIRKRIFQDAIAAGARPFEVRASTAKLLSNIEIGNGAVLCDQTMITSDVKIGVGFHLNIFAYVEHDCVIGDFVTFAPRASCNGNVVIGDGAYIGAGAVIKQGNPEKKLIIGAGAVIGMGAVVINDVPPYTTVVGNPAKPITKKNPWQYKKW